MKQRPDISAAEGFYVATRALNDTARRKMVNLWMLAASNEDRQEYQRVVQREKKASQRGNVPPASSIPGGQNPNVPPASSIPGGQNPNVPPASSIPGGQIEISPSPAGSDGFPDPSLAPNPHPTPYNPPPSQQNEPSAEPAAPGESEQNRLDREEAERARAQRRALAAQQIEQVAAIMHRKPGSKWSDKEKRGFRKLFPFNADEIASVKEYYDAEWPPDRDQNILRHDLATLLNNWPSEVDRARRQGHKPKRINGHGLNAADPSADRLKSRPLSPEFLDWKGKQPEYASTEWATVAEVPDFVRSEFKYANKTAKLAAA